MRIFSSFWHVTIVFHTMYEVKFINWRILIVENYFGINYFFENVKVSLAKDFITNRLVGLVYRVGTCMYDCNTCICVFFAVSVLRAGCFQPHLNFMCKWIKHKFYLNVMLEVVFLDVDLLKNIFLYFDILQNVQWRVELLTRNFDFHHHTISL